MHVRFMGQKGSGIERFLAPSLSKIEDELRSIYADVDAVKNRMDEFDNRITKLEGGHKQLTSRFDSVDNSLSAESQILIDNISDNGKQNRDEIESLKRAIDVAQRRIVVLEAKMKELGQ